MFDDHVLDKFVAYTASQEGASPLALISTDDNMRLEYATPRNNVPGLPTIPETIVVLSPWRDVAAAERLVRR
jgi:hypothetical protein